MIQAWKLSYTKIKKKKVGKIDEKKEDTAEHEDDLTDWTETEKGKRYTPIWWSETYSLCDLCK